MDSGLIITGILGLLLIIMAIVLLTGRGSSLIAGYNTMSKSEKENYDSRALCKFMGKILLPIGMLTPFLTLGSRLNITWFPFAYSALVLGIVVFAAIYANTGNRFKK